MAVEVYSRVKTALGSVHGLEYPHNLLQLIGLGVRIAVRVKTGWE